MPQPKLRDRARPRARMDVDARRDQLLALGIRAFSERPYDDVSTVDIAKKAGISHGLLFHYFPTKRAFYLAALRVAADQLLKSTVLATDGTTEERLVAGLDAYFGFVEEHERAYATLLRGGADPAAGEILDATRARFVAILRAYLPEDDGGGKARAALRAWIGLVEALALDWIEHRDLSRAERVALAVRGIAVALPDGGASALPARPAPTARRRR